MVRAGLTGPTLVALFVLVVIAAVAFRPNERAGELTAAKTPADTTPPTVSVVFPAASGAYRSSTWSNGCTPTGVCGTASDASGLTSVKVAVLQASTGKYWNGSVFSLAARTFQPATGTSSWKYAFAAPADGAYTVYVLATDGAGNTTPAASAPARSFQIDNAPPPIPTLTKTPDDPTGKDSAQFNWTDAESAVTFTCSLDGSVAVPCTSSGNEYKNLGPGEHCFAVRAVDAAGNTSGPRSFCWTIAGGKTFVIAGDADAPFSPGVRQRLDLQLSNANNFTVRVTAITVTVQPGTTKNGSPNPACSGTSNMVVVQQLTGTVDVPANATKRLSELGVAEPRRPLVEMRNLSVNQDACKSTTFSFTYSGTAAKP